MLSLDALMPSALVPSFPHCSLLSILCLRSALSASSVVNKVQCTLAIKLETREAHAPRASGKWVVTVKSTYGGPIVTAPPHGMICICFVIVPLYVVYVPVTTCSVGNSLAPALGTSIKPTPSEIVSNGNPYDPI